MSDFDYSLRLNGNGPAPEPLSDRTRKVYDYLAGVYPVSSFLFHSKAHKRAIEMAGIRNGMRVLEAATGSGEMFRRLVEANPNGATAGFDLSPRMAARTQKLARQRFPAGRIDCQAVDARHLPFADESFDAVVCCYLLELLPSEDIPLVLREFRRVLKRKGTFTLVLIGEHTAFFNAAYKVCGSIAPAFWGRQVDRSVPDLLPEAGLRLTAERTLRQGFYPSRVLCAKR